jgi:hypothetical protein
MSKSQQDTIHFKQRRKQTLKYTFAALFAVAAAGGYCGLRRLKHRDRGLAPVRRSARKLAKILLHTEATAAQETGVAQPAYPTMAR